MSSLTKMLLKHFIQKKTKKNPNDTE
jgi:hypothetical protein